jgi:hypothetical protein
MLTQGILSVPFPWNLSKLPCRVLSRSKAINDISDERLQEKDF